MSVDDCDGRQRTSRYMLPPRLDYAAAADLCDELGRRRGHDLEIDGSKVQQASGSCLHILLSAALEWERDGRVFGLSGTSAALEEALALLGLKTHLHTREAGQCN